MGGVWVVAISNLLLIRSYYFKLPQLFHHNMMAMIDQPAPTGHLTISVLILFADRIFHEDLLCLSLLHSALGLTVEVPMKRMLAAQH